MEFSPDSGTNRETCAEDAGEAVGEASSSRWKSDFWAVLVKVPPKSLVLIYFYSLFFIL